MHHGMARHLYYLSPKEITESLKLDWISHAFAISATGLGKIAFSVFLLRIIPKSKPWMRRFLHGSNALLVAINMPLIILTYVQCDPVAGLWEPNIGAKCWNPHIQDSYALFQGCTQCKLARYQTFADLRHSLRGTCRHDSCTFSNTHHLESSN